MSVTITRTAWTDDDGTGTTGTVINNAVKTGLYDQIDVALALLSTPNNLAYDLLPDADGTRKLGSAAKSWDGSEIIALNATNLSAGTVPDARFPATLPAASGINLTALNGTNIASGTVADARLPGTMASKRITPRVTTIVSNATPTINTDNCDAVTITAQAAAITSMTTNLTGTPTNFDKLIIRIKDDGTGRAITWGASFLAKGTALPTTTVATKLLTVGFIYDTVAAVWGCVASAQEA